MSLEITQVKNYLEKIYTDGIFLSYRNEVQNSAWELAVHAFGLFPSKLISERRPNEPEVVFNYRCSIYEPITKKYIGKVITELNKIRRSTDWAILFNKNTVPAKLVNNTLENYITYDLPVFDSLTNWLFSLALPTYLIDANAFIVVVPEKTDIAANELVNPVPEIIPCDRIRYYIPNQLLIWIDEMKCEYRTYDEEGNAYLNAGDIVHILTPLSYSKYEQVDENYRLKETANYDHNLGYLPVTQTGGIVKQKISNLVIYRSRISDMVPDLNEAVREYSDLQAEAVNNIYSERWEFSQNECSACNGSGEIKEVGFANACTPCKKCNGTGHTPRSPYSKLVIKPELGQDIGSLPIPPAGYIEKSTEIIKIQDERVRQHVSDALSAINMSFLEDVPLNESGKAKEVDRDALNTFVHSIAEDIVAIADRVVRYINDMRYSILVPDKEKREAMLPDIIVPERFDILNADYLLKEISDAQSSNVSPVIINALQKEYASKKFNASPEIRQRLELTLLLDPLSGITDDDKLTRLSAKGISQTSYIVSSSITEFIDRALFEHKDEFYSFDYDKQRDILNGYAAEVMAAQINSLVPEIDNEP